MNYPPLHFSMRNMQLMMNQQSAILQQIGAKLDINGPGPALTELMASGVADNSSMYDNINVTVGHHNRAKSIRVPSVDGKNRPKSIKI